MIAGSGLEICSGGIKRNRLIEEALLLSVSAFALILVVFNLRTGWDWYRDNPNQIRKNCKLKLAGQESGYRRQIDKIFLSYFHDIRSQFDYV